MFTSRFLHINSCNHRLWFMLFASLCGGVLLLALLVDLSMSYKMCELCITQRIVILVCFVLSICGLRASKELALWWFLGLFICIIFGLWLGFWHQALLKHQLESSLCALVSKPVILPQLLFDLLSTFYTFMPCNSAAEPFLGLSFPAWSILLHSAMLSIFGAAITLFTISL